MDPIPTDTVTQYYYSVLYPHRDDLPSSTVLGVSEALAAKARRIQHIQGLSPSSESLAMSFGEVDKNGVRNVTAYVVRGVKETGRQTRVEWVAVKEGQNVVEAFGKKVGGIGRERNGEI